MEDEEDTTAAMAQAMGFSSFGAQNPNKRRKFNPHADAVVATDATSAIPLREAASGSNATPLGVRIRNEDEVDLEEDEEASGASGNKAHGDVKTQGQNDDDTAPQYQDTSRSPVYVPDDLSEDVQSRINAITGDPSSQYLGTQSSSFDATRGTGVRGSRGGYQANQWQGRDSGKNWWEDYYDPKSNVNPWEQLENTRGLEPRGSWMTWEEAKKRSGFGLHSTQPTNRSSSITGES
ncbi:hypothetical protein M426DRAFT_11258 [Hypoxylon sp. CI-4A]|nr:hypothetical protein M426DRAFT_11258 [Hypoxylon sp. CI-4A]